MDQQTTIDRDALPGVAPLFVERWSPRAFAPAEIGEETLARLIEAARWAPSCYNEQPWRFYTSTRETFGDYLDLLLDLNQAWARHASVLGFVVGKTRFERNGKENSSSDLDCGAAWMSMALQAREEGLYAHGMAGIHHDEIARYLGLDSDSERVLMGFAIGRIGDPAQLDEDFREKEFPSLRKPLAEIWFRG